MNNSLRKLITIFTMVSFISMTGCVGMFRSATLEPTYLPSDEKMTCDQVQNQMKQIDDRAAQTNNKAKGMIAYNAAMFILGFIIIIPWFLMDLSGTENKEVDSMRARWNYLDDLAKTKECDMTGVKTAFLDGKPREKKAADKPSTFTPSGGNVVQSKTGLKENTASITTSKEPISSINNPEATAEFTPKVKDKLAIFPISGRESRSVKPATISAISKELLRVSYLETTFSYYDLGEYIKAKRIPPEIINEATEERLYKETEPNISEIRNLGERLEVDYVCGAKIKFLGYNEGGYRISIYLVDVHRERFFKEDYDLPTLSAYSSVGNVVRKFFDEFNYIYITWKRGN